MSTEWTAPGQTPPNHGPEFGGSSPIGLVVILLLAVAVIFLVRSMNKHLRKVPPSFDAGEPEGPEESTHSGEPAGSGGSPPSDPDAPPPP